MKMSRLAGLTTAIALVLTVMAAPAASWSAPEAGPSVVDRAGAQSLVDRAGVIVMSRWTPGGPREIISMRPDGSQLKVLTTGGRDEGPKLSPDGRSIAFTRCNDFRCWFAIMNSDGTGIRPLRTCEPFRCDRPTFGGQTPSFSPDGKSIAFQAIRLVGEDGLEHTGIFIRNLDGTGLRQVTDGFHSDPQFSPDGRSLVFIRQSDIPGDTVYHLSIVRTDGTQLRFLRQDVAGYWPDWGAGSRIAFITQTALGLQVATVGPDGRDLRILTDVDGDDVNANNPTFSPAGVALAYTVDDNQDFDCVLRITSARGGPSVLLPTGGRCVDGLDWGSAPR